MRECRTAFAACRLLIFGLTSGAGFRHLSMLFGEDA
jgi:hypothetical protein